MNEIIDKLIDKHIEEIIEVRRDIHAHPELGMNEVRTSKLVAEKLKGLGLEVTEGVGGTGVVALLKGKNPGKTILLRADMDALPMGELTNLPFKSQVEGVMHACGHDVHTSTLLGAAKVLSEIKDQINGQIKFVFQPAEECNPTGGAMGMIKEGVLQNPKVDAAVALHVWNVPVGQVSLKTGPMMAESDRIFIKIKGKSSHGSAPHQGADAIVAASYVITALQTIVSRNIDPMDSAVISIGKISGGYRYNVIADEVELEGTVRTFDPNTAKKMPDRIEGIIKNVCEALGCQYEFRFVNGYPVTYNDEGLTKVVISALEKALGKENVVIADKPAAGGEDFSFFTREVPSTFIWLGCLSEINKDCCVIHNPNFVCDEGSIPVGIKALCATVFEFLGDRK